MRDRAEVEFLPVGPAHAARVRSLMRAAFAGTRAFAHPSSALRESTDDVAEVLARGGGVIARAEGADVASARFFPEDDALVIERLGVLPAHRGRGLGAALVGWLVEHARELGCVEVRANARSQMPDNRPFWIGLGFEVVATSGRYGIPDLRTHLRRVL